ncbi:T9SS type A sorting domain-containing protein [Candidatus Poribacteria bacterium]|nr:T9SS type A sorting domain-containing protein [Candidatus Poribacteria bacterium]
MNADGTLTITVGADAIAGYNGPAFTTQISVSDTTEPRILTEKPVESDYDHIEGPWLWMIAPGGDIDADNLSGASDGVITEARIAQSGVNEGDHFNDLQWTSGRLLPTTVCGIFVCSSENVINVVKEIGLTDKDQLNSYSAYALINIASPRDQNDVLMGVGSDDSIKVWLNGSVVYKNDVSRRTKGIQNRFPVHLNAGDNLLLIKVCNHSALFGNNDWGMFFKLYLDTQDYTLSLPMVLPGTQQPVAPEVTETPQQPQQPGNTGGTPTLTVSTASPLTEATLDESIITLTLSGRKFERRNSAIRRAVSVSGISGVTVRNSDIDRQSDTEVSVELTYDGDMRTDGTLTITVGADAIAGYDGPALTVQLSVSAADEPVAGGQTPDPTQQPGNTGGTPTLTVSTASPLTEATLHGGVVTLTLSSGTYERSSWRMREAITVSGISGLAFDKFSVDRVSDTQVTLELEFDGNMNANGTLTISVGAGTIKDYDGAALTGQIAVSAVTESITVSTASPLTEATLDESVITLTLSGRKFERWNSTIRLAVSVSGIAGVTVRSFDIDRESDTEVTVELTFNGNMNADGTLTITVGADAIAGYDGPAFTARLHVTANTESVAASTTAPLKEATLDGSVVTLTLSGAKYAKSIWDLREAVSVSGINGVTIPWHQPRRKSDTEITIKLEFDGNMNTDGTLTFTVGADAIAGYNGALTAQITVTADRENILLANFPNPFNPETWIPYQLAKDADVTLHIYSVNGTLIQTLTLGYQPAGFYYSRSRAAYWDGKNALGEPVASGVYFYTITAGDFTATRKMLIRK